MLISKKWLSDYIKIDDVEDKVLSDLLSLSGTEVDTISNPWEGLKNIRCGRILQINKHPQADKIVVCKVDFGNEVLQILTADNSVKVDDNVIVAADFKSSLADFKSSLADFKSSLADCKSSLADFKSSPADCKSSPADCKSSLLEGTKLYNGKEIKKSEIRGVVSEGMMCSLEELGLENKSEFVYKLDPKLKAGENLYKYFKLDDSVFDLEITANRGDELSYIGIAREIQAIGKTELKYFLPRNDYEENGENTEKLIKINIENPENCNRYCSIVLEGINVQESPIWLKRHIIASGLRPINNVVDITNFVLLELGHPVHAFDLDRLQKPQIVVRNAKKGEELLLLNGEKVKFDGEELLITDGENPIALAGVMGGELSSVNENTKRVLLEVAHFSPVSVRKTAKKFSLSSDASYRFERGIDINDSIFVLKRLAHMIQKICGGSVSKGIVDVYVNKVEPRRVPLRKERVEKILGMEYTKEKIVHSLLGLGLSLEEEKCQKDLINGQKPECNEIKWQVTIPTFRNDLEREIDIIEEIGRVNGYDNLQGKLPAIVRTQNGRSVYQEFKYKIREILLGLGYNEVSPMTFIDPEDFKKFVLSEEHEWVKNKVQLLKPLSRDISVLRPNPIISVLKTLAYNYTRQINDIKIFEIGIGFKKEENYHESDWATFCAVGKENKNDYTDKREVDFYTFKGVLVELIKHSRYKESELSLKRVNENGEFSEYYPLYYPSKTAVVCINEKPIGIIGQIRNTICENYDIKADTYMGHINLEELYQKSVSRKEEWKSVQGLNYPSSKKDFSVLVPRGKEIGHIIQKIRDTQYVETSQIVDLYKGKNIPAGYISVTVSVILRAKDHTMAEEEVYNTINIIRNIFKEENLEIRDA